MKYDFYDTCPFISISCLLIAYFIYRIFFLLFIHSLFTLLFSRYFSYDLFRIGMIFSKKTMPKNSCEIFSKGNLESKMFLKLTYHVMAWAYTRQLSV